MAEDKMQEENRQYRLCERAFREAQTLLKQTNPDTSRLSEIVATLEQNKEGTELLREVFSFKVEQVYDGIAKCLSANPPKPFRPIAIIGGNGIDNLLTSDGKGKYRVMPYQAGGN